MHRATGEPTTQSLINRTQTRLATHPLVRADTGKTLLCTNTGVRLTGSGRTRAPIKPARHRVVAGLTAAAVTALVAGPPVVAGLTAAAVTALVAGPPVVAGLTAAAVTALVAGPPVVATRARFLMPTVGDSLSSLLASGVSGSTIEVPHTCVGGLLVRWACMVIRLRIGPTPLAVSIRVCLVLVTRLS